MAEGRGGEPVFVVPEGEPLLAAVERGLREGGAPLGALPALSDLAARDPFLARELAALHAGWELRPPPAPGPLARLRARLAWWLLGPELAQASGYHAHLARVVDSLVAHLDAERAARAALEARLRSLEGEP